MADVDPNKVVTNQIRIALDTLEAVISRTAMLSRLGKDTYEGNRDIYEALGYPKTIQPEDYWNRYDRQDLAGAINDRPVEACWESIPTVQDNVDPNTDSTFESAWKELSDRLQINEIFSRVDSLTGLGRYGILLLGFK